MPPDYANGLVLASTKIVHSLVSRPAYITYALHDLDNSKTAQQWADYLQLNFATDMKPVIDSQAVISSTHVLKGDGGPTPFTATSTAAPTAGTSVTTSPPPQVAVLVKEATGVSGRRNRGRMYFPWAINESAIDEAGVITPADLASFQARLDLWFPHLNSATHWQMVVANRFYDAPWTDPNRKLIQVTYGSTVTALTAANVVATQRRRLVRP